MQTDGATEQYIWFHTTAKKIRGECIFNTLVYISCSYKTPLKILSQTIYPTMTNPELVCFSYEPYFILCQEQGGCQESWQWTKQHIVRALTQVQHPQSLPYHVLLPPFFHTNPRPSPIHTRPPLPQTTMISEQTLTQTISPPCTRNF